RATSPTFSLFTFITLTTGIYKLQYPLLGLLRLADFNDPAFGTGDGPFHQQQVLISHDLHYFKALHGCGLSTHTARHLLILEGAAGGSTHTDGTRGTVECGAVSCPTSAEAMAFDNALETFTFR